MITCKFLGRLGNHMYQAATVIKVAEDLNTDFVIPTYASAGHRGNIPSDFGGFVYDFKYPTHFKHPDGEVIFAHMNHIDVWEQLLDQINVNEQKERIGDRVAIEIGTAYGGSAVHLLDRFVNRENDFLHCIDIKKHPLLESNLAPYKNVKLHIGKSFDELLDLNYRYRNPVADLIYIDGSHTAKNIIEDVVLSWNLLKVGGVMIFDDYGWGETNTVDEMPKTGIDAILHGYQTHYFMIGSSYQIYIQKVKEGNPINL